MTQPGARKQTDQPWADFLKLWRIVEFQLDLCIVSLFAQHGDKITEKTNQIQLARKLDFMRAAYAEVPELAGSLWLVEELVAKFTVNKSLRNDITHGFPMKVEPDGTTHIVWPQPKQARMLYHRRVVSPRQWEKFEKDNIWLFAVLLGLYIELNPGAAVLDQNQQVTREFAMDGISRLPASKAVRDLFEEVLARLF